MTEKIPALVVVDMINDYVHPEGELYGDVLHDIVPNIEKLLTLFREAGLPVIFANTSTVSDEQPMVKKWGEHAARGTWGERVIDTISQQESDYIVLDLLPRLKSWDSSVGNPTRLVTPAVNLRVC